MFKSNKQKKNKNKQSENESSSSSSSDVGDKAKKIFGKFGFGGGKLISQNIISLGEYGQ